MKQKKKTTKKKSKSRTKSQKHFKNINLTKKQEVYLAIGIVAIVILAIGLYTLTYRYNGLGMPQNVGINPYSDEYYYWDDGFLRYDDEFFTSKTVIDVSAYQKEIDWKKVKEQGVDYAIIRVGYRGYEGGTIYEDKYYEENLKGAKEAGIKIGAYFFSQAINPKEAIEEAKCTLRHVRKYDLDLPIFFDMENVTSNDRIKDLTVKEKTEIAHAFCEHIEEHGYKAGVYGNPHWFNESIDLSYLTDFTIWLAHYTDFTTYNSNFNMWQYSESGNLEGINEEVDMNIMYVPK